MGKRLAVFAVLAVLFVAQPAHSLPESTRGPFYVQGTTPLGFNDWGGRGYAYAAWRPDAEFGIHFTGRHDGFVLGIRQAFLVGDFFGGTTVLKLGYDIPIPIKKYELNIGPYGTIGVGYLFDNGRYGGFAGLQTGFVGVDVKFFIIKGFYAFGRPFEFGMQCRHDAGSGCWFQFIFGAGVGFAFPSPGG